MINCKYCKTVCSNSVELVNHYIDKHPESREASKGRFVKLRKNQVIRRTRTDKERVSDNNLRFKGE